MTNPICFALDVSSAADAARLVDLLDPHVGAFKVGLEMFIATGALPRLQKPVILDLKLHDIPETVARAVTAGGDLGAKFMTLHVQQRKTLELALKAAEQFDLTLLGVTVLTSMSRDDLSDLRMLSTWGGPSGAPGTDPGERAFQLAKHGYDCGLRGFVCSPQEVKQLKATFPDAFFLVPGVRPAGSATGDQKRVGTPAQAVRDGASLIVVGRPIRDASDPVAAAKAILAEISEGVEKL